MKPDVIERANQLSPEQQQEVENLINKLFEQGASTSDENLSVSEKRKKNMDWARGKIWMADDFNDTPEDFKDYL